MVESMFPGKTW